MVVYDEQIDDSPAEGYVLYRGENHTYAGKNGNVLHLYDFTIISDDPNTELTASLDECLTSAETAIQIWEEENEDNRFELHTATYFFEKAEGVQFPLFKSAWVDEGPKVWMEKAPSIFEDEDSLALYLQDEAGNVYCILSKEQYKCVLYNGQEVYFTEIIW